MLHQLKIWPQFYEAVCCGDKNFEYRVNDRAFQKGDTVVLREWDPEMEYIVDSTPMGNDYARGTFTGKSLEFKIGYVLPVSSTHVVFSLLPMEGKE